MNPLAIIQQLITNNNPLFQSPVMQNAMQMMQRNDVNSLKALAENLCNERGISLADAQEQVKAQFHLR